MATIKKQTLEDHQKMSDEDLIGMYAKEFGSKTTKQRPTCPGCTSLATCQCALQTGTKNTKK